MDIAELKDTKADLLNRAEQLKAQRQTFSDVFNGGNPLTVGEFSILSGILERSTDKEADTNRFTQALIYNRQQGIDLADAYANIEALNEAQMGKKGEYTKAWTQAVSDSFRVGELNKQRSELGMKFHDLEADRKDTAEIMAEIDAIDAQIEQLQDNTPRGLGVTLMKWAAGTIPYTGEVLLKGATAGMAAALVATGVGAVAGVPMLAAATLGTSYTLASLAYGGAALAYGWKRTADLSRGAMYYDLRKQGVEKNIAEWASSADGWVQGAVENFLGLTPMAAKAVGNVLGREAATGITTRVLSRLYANGIIGGLAAGATKWVQGAAGEGAEEFFQSIADSVTEYTVAEISDSGYTFDKTAKEVLKQALYEGVAGFGSALVLGGLPAAINTRADMGYSRNLKNEAELIPSKEMYIRRHQNDEQFSDLTVAQRKDTLGEIYDKNHTIEGVSNAEAANLDTDYLAINEVEEQGDEETETQATDTPTEPIKRRKDHRLHAQESTTVTENADGSESHTLKLGSADSRRRYGRIEFTVDGDTVTIDNVYLKAGQEALTGEFITELMRRYEGYNIEWQPTTKSQIKVRDQLIKDNKENPGQLQMFKGKNMDEVLEATGYLKEKLPNLNRHEATVAAGLMRVIAEGRGRTLQQFIHDDIQFKTFAEAVSNDVMSEQEAALNKGAYQLIENGTKAIIYVGKEGDFSTLFHEVVHFISQTSPQSKDLATALKGAVDTEQFRKYLEQHKRIMDNTGLDTDGIISAIKEMSDNPMEWNRAQNEIVAVLGETYAQEGRTFNPELQTLFDKIIDFFMKIYRMLKQNALLNDDIVKAYDALLAGNPELRQKYEAQDQTATQQQESYDDNGLLKQANPTQAEIAEAERQYKEIESKYKGTDQWLKAPNGKPTKLTERQWVQVRTPAFKAWFGDWENDPANASKVVDENGEPLVVYHGTAENFNIFDYTKGKIKSDRNTKSYMFTTSKELAAKFSEAPGETGFPNNVFEVFINLRDPSEYNFDGASQSGFYLDKFAIYGLYNQEIKTTYIDEEENTFSTREEAEKYIQENDIEDAFINNDYVKIADDQNIVVSVNKLVEDKHYNKEYGFSSSDGLTIKNVRDTNNFFVNDFEDEDEKFLAESILSDFYIVFSPNQIKSATDNVGTFSQSNPSILFQIIGEQGAAALDQAEESNIRLDNLSIARQMEKEGKDALSIRRATGWERGKDKKWRYEIDDGEFSSKGFLTNPDVIEYRELERKFISHLQFQPKSREEIEDSLMADAKGQTLDEWLDFNRFLGDGDLDEAALTAIWEKANHIEVVEGEKVVETAPMSEEEKDNAFLAMIDTDDGVRKFIQDLRSVDAYLKDIEREGIADEEDMDFLNRLADASKRIETEAAPFIKNLLKNNKDLSEESIKKVRGMAENNLTAYRDLYAAASGNENLTSNIEALPFIDEPTRENMQTMSIAEKRRLVDNLEAQELKKKILKGEELYDGEAEKVVKMLDAEIQKLEGEKEALKASLDNKQDWLDIKDKKLIKVAEEAKATEKAINKLERNIRSRLDKGMRISKEDYQKLAGWKDKLELLQDDVNALNKQTKLKAILQEREKYRQKQAELKQKQKERQFAKKVHDYKVKLVSYIMKKPSKTVNWEQAEQILALQAVFGRTSGYDNFYINMNGKRLNLTAFRGMVDRGEINVAGLTDYQLKRYFNKSLAEYTVEDLETLADTVRYLKEQGRHEWQAKVDQRNFEARQWQNLLINEIAGNPRYTDAGDEPLPESGESIKKKRTLEQMVRTGWYKTLNMARKAQMIDGNRKATAYRLLVEEKRRIQEAELIAIRKRMQPVLKMMKDLGVKPQDLYEMHTLKIGKNEQHYTTSQLIYGLKAQLEQRNLEAFMYGNLISQREKEFYGHNDNTLRLIGEARLDDFIKQAQAILAGKENITKVAEAIWNDWQNKDNFSRLNQAALDEYNMPVDPVAFYMPISRKDFNGTELAAKIADDLYNTNAGKGMTAVEKGMTKARLTISPDHQMPVDTDYFKLWTDSVADQEHFIASNAYVRKLNRVFKALGSKDLRANIEAVYGDGMMNDIDNYINEVANPNINTDTQGVNRFLRLLRGSLYPAYLAYKSSSVLLQMITSPAPFLREVGPVELAKGLVQMSLHPVETWRYVTELSATMEKRSMNPLIDEVKKAAQNYTDPKYWQLWHKIQKIGTMGLELADRWAVTAGWLVVFDKKKAEYEAQGMEAKQAEREAVKYADTVVLETQPTGDKTELAPLFKKGDPAWQAFIQFQVSLNVIWNNLTYDVLASDRVNHERRKAMGTLIGYALAGALLYSVQEGFDDDDDAEDIILKLLYGATTQYTASIPLVSSNIDNIIRSKMTGDAWYSRSSQLYPGLDALGQYAATGNKEKLARAVGIFSGAAVSGWKEFEHSFYNRKKGEWRFYPKAFLGRREK